LEELFARGEKAMPPSWLVPELVPASGSVMLAGIPGCGKTWLCMAIARRAVEIRRPVFFIEEEGSVYGLCKRLKSMNFPDDSGVRVLHRKSFRVDIVEQLSALCATLVSTPNSVVILDPLVMLWVGDENKTGDVSNLVQRFQALRNFEDALIMVPTHT